MVLVLRPDLWTALSRSPESSNDPPQASNELPRSSYTTDEPSVSIHPISSAGASCKWSDVSSLTRTIYPDSGSIPQLLAMMPLVGPDSPVQCSSNHGTNSNLLGPLGHRKPQVFASAEGHGLFGAEHGTVKENTSTDECASDENSSLQPLVFLRSHHSTLLNTRRSRRSDSLSIIVSNYYSLVHLVACIKFAHLPRIV